MLFSILFPFGENIEYKKQEGAPLGILPPPPHVNNIDSPLKDRKGMFEGKINLHKTEITFSEGNKNIGGGASELNFFYMSAQDRNP